jgi:hypothetical protein
MISRHRSRAGAGLTLPRMWLHWAPLFERAPKWLVVYHILCMYGLHALPVLNHTQVAPPDPFLYLAKKCLQFCLQQNMVPPWLRQCIPRHSTCSKSCFHSEVYCIHGSPFVRGQAIKSTLARNISVTHSKKSMDVGYTGLELSYT